MSLIWWRVDNCKILRSQVILIKWACSIRCWNNKSISNIPPTFNSLCCNECDIVPNAWSIYVSHVHQHIHESESVKMSWWFVVRTPDQILLSVMLWFGIALCWLTLSVNACHTSRNLAVDLKEVTMAIQSPASRYDSEGYSQESQSISTRQGGGGGSATNWMNFHDVHAQNLGQGEKVIGPE